MRDTNKRVFKESNRTMYVVAVAVTALVVLLGMTKRGEVEAAQAEYCSMVEIGIETDGEYGWPDFQHRYEDDCQ